MSGAFRAGALELADEVARLHESGPGLPAAEIGARSRRLRRRREVALVVVSSAAVGALVLGGAALVERGTVAPPVGTPSVDDSAPVEPSPSSTPTSSSGPTEGPTPPPTSVTPPTSVELLTATDLDRLALDPEVLTAAVAGLGELERQPAESTLEDWGLDEAVVVHPDETCRPALTVVADAPSDFRAVGWSSGTADVHQEIVVLADKRAAAAAFATLGEALRGCPEFGASLPESSGAWHVITDLAFDEASASFRAAGSERGEGAETGWVQVDVLVANVILRTEVFTFEVTTAAAADASAVGDVVEQAIRAGLTAPEQSRG